MLHLKKLLLILPLSFMLAGEMEVDGSLTVTGDINSPTIDALSGMKPDRIYGFQRESNQGFTFTVPDGKMWVVQVSPEFYLSINGSGYLLNSGYSPILLPGSTLQPLYTDQFYLNILEYPISGLGTSQGMNYIIP